MQEDEMRPYPAQNHDSGVTAFAIGPDFITLRFRDGSLYRYDHDRPGRDHVERMKELAVAGRGLTTYINKHVRRAFAVRLA